MLSQLGQGGKKIHSKSERRKAPRSLVHLSLLKNSGSQSQFEGALLEQVA